MTYFAVHDGSTVLNVIKAESQEIAESVTDLAALETEGIPWIGWTLESEGWRRPSPFPSWVWVDGEWTAPVPMPSDGSGYEWDEDTLSWVDVSNP